jgi:hypothetical protein
VHGLMANPPGSAWSFGGSILTFAFPMILFIVVAGALYVLYTKPEFVPGHRPDEWERPVSYTAVPGKPTQQDQAQATPVTAAPAAPTATAETSAGEAAGTEDAE